MNGIQAGYCSIEEYRAGKPAVMGEDLVKGFYTAMFTLEQRGRRNEEAARYPAWVKNVERVNGSGLYAVELELLDVNLQVSLETEALLANGLLVRSPPYGINIGRQVVNGGYLMEDQVYSIPRADVRPVLEDVPNPALVPAIA